MWFAASGCRALGTAHDPSARTMLTIRNTSSSDNPLENEDFLAELLQVGFHAMVAVAVLGFGAVSGHDRSACLVFFDTGNRVAGRASQAFTALTT